LHCSGQSAAIHLLALVSLNLLLLTSPASALQHLFEEVLFWLQHQKQMGSDKMKMFATTDNDKTVLLSISLFYFDLISGLVE